MDSSNHSRQAGTGSEFYGSAEQVKDAHLLAFLDGALDAERHAALTALLNQNAALHQRLRDLAREQIGLEHTLRHLHAPTPQMLGEYALDLLSPEEKQALEARMRQYPHLAYEANRLRHDLAQIAPHAHGSAQSTSSSRSLAATLMPASSGALATGMRGEEMPQRLYEADGTQIILEIQPDAGTNSAESTATRHTIVGLVLAAPHANDNQSPDDGASAALAQLFEGEQLVAQTEVDAAGNFMLPHLPLAVYDLVISDSHTNIFISDLTP